MARGHNLQFDTNHAVEINPVGRGATVSSPDSFAPCCGEPDARDLLEQINPIGRQPNLYNLLKVAAFQQQRAAKFRQRLVGAADILCGGINPQINVFREARFGVIDECEAADDEVADAMSRQQVQDVFEIADRLHERSTTGTFASSRDCGEVSAESDQRGQTLLRGLTLPELQIPPVSFRKTARAMGGDDAFALPCSLLDAHLSEHSLSQSAESAQPSNRADLALPQRGATVKSEAESARPAKQIRNKTGQSSRKEAQNAHYSKHVCVLCLLCLVAANQISGQRLFGVA